MSLDKLRKATEKPSALVKLSAASAASQPRSGKTGRWVPGGGSGPSSGPGTAEGHALDTSSMDDTHLRHAPSHQHPQYGAPVINKHSGETIGFVKKETRLVDDVRTVKGMSGRPVQVSVGKFRDTAYRAHDASGKDLGTRFSSHSAHAAVVSNHNRAHGLEQKPVRSRANRRHT